MTLSLSDSYLRQRPRLYVTIGYLGKYYTVTMYINVKLFTFALIVERLLVRILAQMGDSIPAESYRSTPSRQKVLAWTKSRELYVHVQIKLVSGKTKCHLITLEGIDINLCYRLVETSNTMQTVVIFVLHQNKFLPFALSWIDPPCLTLIGYAVSSFTAYNDSSNIN